MSEHTTIQEQLAIFDTLKPAEHQQVEHHLRTCAECRDTLVAYQKMDQALHRLVDERLRYLSTQPLVQPKFASVRSMNGQGRPSSHWFAGLSQPFRTQRIFVLELAGASVLILLLMMLSLFFFAGWEPSEEQRLASTPTVVEPTVTATPTTPSVWDGQLAVHDASADAVAGQALVIARQSADVHSSDLQRDGPGEYFVAHIRPTPLLIRADAAPWDFVAITSNV